MASHCVLEEVAWLLEDGAHSFCFDAGIVDRHRVLYHWLLLLLLLLLLWLRRVCHAMALAPRLGLCPSPMGGSSSTAHAPHLHYRLARDGALADR